MTYVNAATVKLVMQTQYFVYIMIYAFIIFGLMQAIVGGSNELDHPGTRQAQIALGSLAMLILMVMLWGGKELY